MGDQLQKVCKFGEQVADKLYLQYPNAIIGIIIDHNGFTIELNLHTVFSENIFNILRMIDTLNDPVYFVVESIKEKDNGRD